MTANTTETKSSKSAVMAVNICSKDNNNRARKNILENHFHRTVGWKQYVQEIIRSRLKSSPFFHDHLLSFLLIHISHFRAAMPISLRGKLCFPPLLQRWTKRKGWQFTGKHSEQPQNYQLPVMWILFHFSIKTDLFMPIISKRQEKVQCGVQLVWKKNHIEVTAHKVVYWNTEWQKNVSVAVSKDPLTRKWLGIQGMS